LGAQPEPYREPLILRYFRLFRERRWLVLGGSLLPALLVALVLVNTRAGARPVVYALSKNVLGNSVLTFLLFLMITMFAAVLREHRHERRRAPISDGGPGSKSGVTALGMAD
jgi:uncharacterized protein involved in exopolysaccharide biosynthesis